MSGNKRNSNPRINVCRVQDLWAHSDITPTGCWLWRGNKGPAGRPLIYTFCHDEGRKRIMSGPTAVWQIAHREGTAGRTPYRTCRSMACVCPAHVAIANTRREMHGAIARLGILKGRPSGAVRAATLRANRDHPNVQKAVPDHLVAEMLRTVGTETGVVVAARLGLSPRTVCKYRSAAKQSAQALSLAAGAAHPIDAAGLCRAAAQQEQRVSA